MLWIPGVSGHQYCFTPLPNAYLYFAETRQKAKVVPRAGQAVVTARTGITHECVGTNGQRYRFTRSLPLFFRGTRMHRGSHFNTNPNLSDLFVDTTVVVCSTVSL